eukprot:3818358-Pyramimonas_sp.AAC.1
MSVPERAAAPRELQPTPGNPSRRRNTDKATSAGRVAVGPDDMLESFLHRLRSSCLRDDTANVRWRCRAFIPTRRNYLGLEGLGRLPIMSTPSWLFDPRRDFNGGPI